MKFTKNKLINKYRLGVEVGLAVTFPFNCKSLLYISDASKVTALS